MFPVSDRFKTAVRQGNVDWIVRTDVVQKNIVVPGGADLEVLDGGVTVDVSADVRRNCSISFLPTVIPTEFTDVLFPGGNELLVKAGFQWSDGTEELCPLGVFRISKPKTNDTDDAVTLQVDGFDRSRAVKRALFTAPYRVAKETPIENAIQDIIVRAFPWFGDDDFVFIETGFTTPQILLDVGDDPWQACTELAAAAGCETFFNSQGQSVLRPIPDPSNASIDWEFHEGDDATILNAGADLDDELAYNGCVATGSSSSDAAPPVRSVVWDRDPSSPTYWDPDYPGISSAYGPVPLHYESDFLRTTAQCNIAAWGQLRKHLGVMQKVSFSAIPNFAQEEGDIASIQRARVRIDAVNVVDYISFPLGIGGEMVLNTRERRLS